MKFVVQKGLTRIKPKPTLMYPPHEVNDDGVCLKTFTFTYKPSNLGTYDAFTHDVKSLLNENLGGIQC